MSATTTSLSTSPGGAPVIIAGIGLYLGAEVLYNVWSDYFVTRPPPTTSPGAGDNGHGTTGFTDSTGPITTLPRTVGPNGSPSEAKPLPLHALARTIIRVGLALLTAAAILSLLDNVLVLANDVPALMAFSFFIEPLWILGALVAFGGVLYARVGDQG